MRKAITSRFSDEDGLTLVELMVTLAIMGVIVAAIMTVLFSAYKETGVVLNRRDVLGDGQFALQQMTKELRQATAINNSSPTSIDVNTYTDPGGGTPEAHQIEWQTSGSAAPYALQTRTDGGAWVTVVSSLASPSVFVYTEHDGQVDQVTITLDLGTTTTTISLVSDVELRNL